MDAFGRQRYYSFFLPIVFTIFVLILHAEPSVNASDVTSKASLIEVDHQGGLPLAVEKMGDHLAGGIGRRLVLFTLASNNRLEPVGSTPPLNGDIENIVIKGSIVYVSVGEGGLYAIDAGDPAHPVIRWHVGQESWGMVVRDNILAVASGWQGLILYGLEQPLQPKQLSEFSFSGNYVHDAALFGDYAYLVNGKKLGVVDIADLNNPVIVSEIGADEYVRFRRIVVQDKRLYLTAHSQGLVLFSLAKPAQPQKIGMYDKLYYAGALYIEGDYAYVSDEGMHVLDITDPANIRQVALGEYSFYDISRFGLYLVAANAERGLHLADISELPQINELILDDRSSYIKLFAMENNTLLGVMPLPGWQSVSRVEAFSLKNPYVPQRGGVVWIPEDVRDIYASGNYAYVAASDGLHVLQIGQDARPIEQSFAPISFPFGVYVHGKYAYLSSPNEGLVVFDIGDPHNPQRVSTLENIRGESLTGTGDYLFTWERSAYSEEQRLLILSLANQKLPVILGSLDVGYSDCDLVSRDMTIYCPIGTDLFIYDASNPSEPRLANQQSVSSELDNPLIAGTRLYANSYNGELTVFDIGQNPFEPTEIVRTKVGSQLSSVTSMGDAVYASGYSSGLTTLAWTTEESLTVNLQEAEFSTEDGRYNYHFTKATFPDFGDFDFVEFTHAAIDPNETKNLPPGLPTSLAFKNQALKYGALGQAISSGPYDLAINYRDSDLGLVDEESLVLYHYDGGQWHSDSTVVIDTTANMVTAQPQHFGLFMLAGHSYLQSFLPTISQNSGYSPPEILGIEVTQGTQTMSNDVPLVANRPTLARIYAAADGGRPLDGASLVLEGTREGAQLPGSPLVQENWAVFPEPDRGKLTHSFNFKLPASWLNGKVKLSARFGSHPTSNSVASEIVFNDVPTLEMVLVPVEAKDTRYGITCPAPKVDIEDIEAYRREIEVLFPVPEVNISVRTSATLEAEDLLDMAWKVASLKSSDGVPNSIIYYGIIGRISDEGYCMDGPTGYALGRLRASAGSNIASVMAHESGHNLGLWHAPCGDPPNPDEDYPYIDASIGTYGYDILNSRVWAPGGPDYAKDFMSYCSPEWISDYNFRKLYEDQRQYGAVADQDLLQTSLLVRVTKRPGEEYELHPVYQLEAVPTTLPEASDLRIELLDNTGQILHSYPLQVVHTEEEEYQMEVAIAAIAIPQDAKVAQVRLRDKELVVADRTLSALTRRNASSEIAFEHSDEGLAIPSLAASKPVLLRFQATGNDNWTTYAVDFNEDEFFLPASSLPKIPGKLEIVMADSTGLGSSKHIDWAIR